MLNNNKNVGGQQKRLDKCFVTTYNSGITTNGNATTFHDVKVTSP